MVRTQIQLTEVQHRELTRYSRRLGISLSEAIRRCVNTQLEDDRTSPAREDRVRAALAVCGKYRDIHGEARVGLDHDRFLEDAYSQS